MTLLDDKGDPIKTDKEEELQTAMDRKWPSDILQEEDRPSDGTEPQPPEEDEEELTDDPSILMQKVPRMFQLTIRGITGQTDVEKLTKWVTRNIHLSIEMHDHIVPNGIAIGLENDESVMRRIIETSQGKLKL